MDITIIIVDIHISNSKLPSHSTHQVIVYEEERSKGSRYSEVVLLPRQYSYGLDVHHH